MTHQVFITPALSGQDQIGDRTKYLPIRAVKKKVCCIASRDDHTALAVYCLTKAGLFCGASNQVQVLFFTIITYQFILATTRKSS